MLDAPLLLPPLLAALLLVVSGIAKVRHPEETRSAFGELQVPRALTDSPAPALLPWAEIVLAVAIIVTPPPFALVVAVLALVLFAVYLAVVVRALGFDFPVTCSCFGRLGLGEVTRRTALRNVLLVVVAALGVWSATADASVAARLLEASAQTWVWLGLVVLTVAVVVVTFGGTKGVTSSGVIGTGEVAGAQDDEDADYARQPIPFATLVEESGHETTMHELTAGGAVLLLFVSPTCGSCRPVIDQVEVWDEGLGPVRVRAVVYTALEDVVAAEPTLAGRVLQDPSAITSRIFRVGTPGAVLLGADGMLAGGPVEGTAAVQEFYDDVRAELVEAGVVAAPEDVTDEAEVGVTDGR
ncbi:hypothetical protein NMQ01_10055 [Janibacter sp. CX7]|uniref:TlpA family protein disulfide reductase n=1 Tax=Janibacter sp. CX7 TaxID=2963431 RepID=UPI0020CD5E62|nr:MauE/DoxX family redox-associated membrane protein [Janibacter sp. CX7]UTT65067.1 hypothetical protein NMQ01_10055 [Janibacter sp. CX7]